MINTAKFDLVIEFTTNGVKKLLENTPFIQGQTISTPFEVELPINNAPIVGNLHLIFYNTNLVFNSDDTISLKLDFEDSSFTSNNINIYGLNGKLNLKIPIELAEGLTDNQLDLTIKFQLSTTEFVFSEESVEEIENNVPIPFEAIKGIIDVEANSFFVNRDDLILQSFQVNKEEDGSLEPLIFTELEVHCISNEDPQKQGLGLFGILQTSNIGKGNHNLKQEHSLVSPDLDFGVTISPETIRRFILCQSLLNPLNVESISNLPSQCGSVNEIDFEGNRITDIRFDFRQGTIDIEILGERSVVKAKIFNTLTLSLNWVVERGVAEKKIIPELSDWNLDIDLPWYLDIIDAAVYGPFINLEEIIEEMVGSNLLPTLNSFDILDSSVNFNLEGVDTIIEHVEQDEKGILINSRFLIPTFAPQYRRLEITQIKRELTNRFISLGEFTNNLKCIRGTFTYYEFLKEEEIEFTVVPILIQRPIEYKWTIANRSNRVELTGENGNVRVPNVKTRYPLPLPSGTIVYQDVEIEFRKTENGLILRNVPENGSYELTLIVEANGIETRGGIEFQGNYVDVSDRYFQRAQECLDLFAQKIKKLTFASHRPIFVKKPAFLLDKKQLTKFRNQLIRGKIKDKEIYHLITLLSNDMVNNGRIMKERL